MKKVVSGILAVVMALSLVGCNSSPGSSSASIDQAAKNEIAAAAKKLSDTYTNYVVSTNVEFAGSTSEYIEVVKGSDIYTEFSVADDDTVGTVPYGSSDTITYALSDWTHDNTHYSFASLEDGSSVIYKFPDNYATRYNNDREMLWVNRMLAGAKSIDTYDDLTLTLEGNEEVYTSYKIVVDSGVVMELLCADTWGVYMSVKDGEKSGSNIQKLCDFYLEDSKYSRTFSDGIAIVGIDSNGILKFMSLEVGGLGTQMYVTKAVVDVRNPNARDVPDFSGAVPLVSTMTEMADFVAQYPDYDSAIRALNELYSSNANVDFGPIEGAGDLETAPVGTDDGSAEGEDTGDGSTEGNSNEDGSAG